MDVQKRRRCCSGEACGSAPATQRPLVSNGATELNAGVKQRRKKWEIKKDTEYEAEEAPHGQAGDVEEGKQQRQGGGGRHLPPQKVKKKAMMAATGEGEGDGR